MTFSLPTSRVPDPQTAPPLKWGIIGTGFIANAFAHAVSAYSSGKVVAVGSRTLSRSKQFAAQYGAEKAYGSYEELVSDPNVEGVYVASPHSEHLEHALLAISAGKPVLVEKAFTRNANEATQVVTAARDARVPLMEAMWTRFLPRTDIVRQLLADGTLGDIKTVIADHGQSLLHVQRMIDPKLAGGALLDLGIYPISYSVFALGLPSKIEAIGALTEAGVDGQTSVILSGYERHPQAQAALTTTMWAKTPTTAVIAGTKARIDLAGDFYTPGPVQVTNNDDQVLTQPTTLLTKHQGLVYEATHFAQIVADGRLESDLLPLDETVAILSILDEIRSQIGFTLPGE